MKVFLFSSQWPEYMIELANALAKKHEVTLMLPVNHRFGPTHRSLISGKINFIPYKVFFHKGRLANIKLFLKIIKSIYKVNPDILHIQANGHAVFKWVFPFLRKKIRIVNTIHDPDAHSGDQLSLKMLDQILINKAKKYSDHYIVHGEFLKSLLAKTYDLDISRISSIPHGHFEIYKKFQTFNRELRINQFLFFGRIWPYKGLEYFIAAANLVISKYPDTLFKIAGKGEKLENYLNKIENPTNFEIINKRLSLDESAQIFEESAVIVLPYIDATQSGIIPVAYAFSKPVIATKVGALEEVVLNGNTGFLINPKDPKQLAEKMLHFIENPSDIKKMGVNAYHFAHDFLNWTSIAEKTSDVYKLGNVKK